MKNFGCNLKRKTNLLRKRISILVQCLILGVFLSSLLFSMYQGENKNINGSIPKASTTHSRISIDGNAALDAFSAGKGTDGLSWDTAHVIEDLEIDAGGLYSGIDIRNTNRFLIIRRVTIINSGTTGTFPIYLDSGISLSSVKNVKITECDVNNNHGGITLINSNYNIISDNIISNNGYKGILPTNSSHNIISGNTVSSSGFVGIELNYHSFNNTISDNTVSNNAIGIDSRDSSNYNTISGNTVSNNGIGIRMLRSFNDTISGNNASYNNDYGIKTTDSNNNIIKDNYASHNGLYGIYLESDSDNNEVYQNIVCNNELGDINDLGSDNDIHDNDDCSQPEGSQPEGIPSYPIAWMSAIVLCSVAVSIYIVQKRRKK